MFRRRFFKELASKPVLAAFVILSMFSNAGSAFAAAANNQESYDDLTAGTVIDASVLNEGLNGVLVEQLNDGSGSAGNNQSAAADPTANANLDATVAGDATNDSIIDQLFGDGSSNQWAGIGGFADTYVNVGLGSNALNGTAIYQTSHDAGQSNQDATTASNANSNLWSSLLAFSSNLLGIDQESGDGLSNQDADLGAGAVTDAAQDLDSSAENGTIVVQDFGSASSGNFNQEADNTSDAASNLWGAQDVGSLNDLGTKQVSGSGPANQWAGIEGGAGSWALQTADGTSFNTVGILQDGDSDGNGNQTAHTMNTALTGLDVLQENGAANLADVLQVAGDGSSNQDTGLGLAANAGADQQAIGISGNTTGVTQLGKGAGNLNQDAAAYNNAQAGVGASQLNGALNDAGIAQFGGDGNNNQANDIGLSADADAWQLVAGGATNVTVIFQDPLGNANQSAAVSNSALANVLGGQYNEGANKLKVLQVGGDYQDNQTNDIGALADADAGQDVAGLATNGTLVTQNAAGLGSTNQSVDDLTSIAQTGVDANQGNLGTNNVFLSQFGGDGNNNQSNSLDLLADADASQVVSGIAGNESFVTQLADGNGLHNQDIDADSAAGTNVWGGQANAATNGVLLSQFGGDDADNQENWIGLQSAANAGQQVGGLAGNTTVLTQDAKGDGLVNQDAYANSLALTGVGADQDNAAINGVALLQIGGGGLDNQTNSIDTLADADAWQAVNGVAANTTTIFQDPTSAANQSANAISQAGTDVYGSQKNKAINGTAIAQFGGGYQANQENWVGETADADAAQEVFGAAGNATAITQLADGGNTNQNAGDPTSIANTLVGAHQANTATNATGIKQIAGLGQNNQANSIDTLADADAWQAVSGGSANTTTVAQTAAGDGNHNQNADALSQAGTQVWGEQGNVGKNIIDVKQVGADYEDNQENWIGADALASADQVVTGISGNDTIIDQLADGDGNVNQAANADSIALTGVEAQQGNLALNGVEIDQFGGFGGQDNQANNIELLADADAFQNVAGAAGNSTLITQDPYSNANQDANALSAAGTTAYATQGNAGTNAIGIAQIGGGDQANQENWIGADALATAGQQVAGLSGNETVIGQLADGGNSNQSASSDALAQTSVGGEQGNLALNAVDLAQVAGDGQNNQSNSLDLLADADAWQAVSGGSANATIITQGAAGEGGNYNQDANAVSQAGTEAWGNQGNVATNAVEIGQVGGDYEDNQENWIGADALATAGQEVVGLSGNTTVIDQLADGDGQSNQNANSLAAAQTGVGATQANAGLNAVGISQLGGLGGQDNQANSLDLVADADAQQSVAGASGNSTVISQDPYGNNNQNADAVSSAGTIAYGTQGNSATNAIGIAQSATGDKQDNQENWIGAIADADAIQQVTGVSGNDTLITQLADGGNTNQNAGDPTSTATTQVAGDQENNALNSVGVAQVSGDGQNNQANNIDAVADADAWQAVSGGSANTTTVAQKANGDGNHNQNADAVSEAGTQAWGTQENNGANVVVIGQVGGEDQDNQENWIGVDALANAGQEVTGLSGNTTVIDQLADGDGNANQTANANSLAGTLVDGQQLNTALNSIGVGQLGGISNSDNQSNSIDAVADADAYQNVSGASGNSTLIAQDPQSNANQDAAAESIANTIAGGSQINGAGNVIGIGQAAGAGLSNQNNDIYANADADAAQQVVGLSGNETTIAQNAEGEGNANQWAGSDSLAGTEVWGAQDNGALNDIEVIAGAGGESSNQNTEIVANADADANQYVGGASGNSTLITQDAKGSGNGNQDAYANSIAATGVGADQNNGAVNNILVTEGCTGPICAQGTSLAPTANANAWQGVEGTSGNVTTIAQDPDAQANQAANADSLADTDVGAAQQNAAVNNTGVTEVCIGKVCAQLAESNANANANADQNVAGASGNGTLIDQDAIGEGSNVNQDANSNSTADTDVWADQQNVAQNNETFYLECGQGNKVCAQLVETSPTANANANQNVNGASENETVITQDAKDGNVNQAADANSNAHTGVDAGQQNAAANNVAITEKCYGTVCAQGAYVTPTANANANQNVEGTSGNTTGIYQDPSGNTNQDANANSASDTGVNAGQQNAAVNNVDVNMDCTGPVCAQGTEVTPTANANATQNVNGTSGNDTTIVQNGGDGNGNQAANSNATSNTVVNANQNNTAGNNVTVNQTGGAANSGNQSATVSPDANANSSVSITGSSGNTSSTTQQN